jgi:protease IV
VEASNGDLAQMALKSGLVDKLTSADTFNSRMMELVGEGEDRDGLPAYNQVWLDEYLGAVRPKLETGDAIAVVYANGEILDGEQPKGFTGGATLSRHVREALANDDVKALVVRVDSPGGSAVAAEQIRGALEQARAAGLPVVVSFGAVAASGGYWLAATADEIWSMPGTITGSIGVFGIVPTFGRTLDQFGIKNDGVGTTPLAGALDISRPMDPAVQRVLQSSVESTYGKFLTLVSQGRKLPVPQVDAIAQGRVWDGASAKQLKLVDQFGGLEQAVAAAAKRANLKSYRLLHVEEPESIETQLLSQLMGMALPATSRAQATEPSAGLVRQLQAASTVLTGSRAASFNQARALCLDCLGFQSPRANRTAGLFRGAVPAGAF